MAWPIRAVVLGVILCVFVATGISVAENLPTWAVGALLGVASFAGVLFHKIGNSRLEWLKDIHKELSDS